MAGGVGDQRTVLRLHPVALWRLFSGLRGRAVLVPVLAVPTAALEAGVAALVAQAAVAMSAGRGQVALSVGPLDLSMSLRTATLLAVVAAVASLLSRAANAVLPPTIVGRLVARERQALLSAFGDADWPTQAAERSGHLQELVTAQVDHTAALLQAVLRLSAAITNFSVMVAAAVLISPVASLAMLVVGGVLFGVLRPAATAARRWARSHSSRSVDLAADVSEAVWLAEEHRVFGTTSVAQARLADAIERVRGAWTRAQIATGLVGSIYQGLVVLILAAGVVAIHQFGVADLGVVGASALILLRSLGSAQTGQAAYTVLHNTAPYLERIREARDAYEDARQRWGTRPLPHVRTITLEDVGYRYTPDVPALDGVSWTLRAGQALGIIGPSGAGKSTLVQVLLRLRHPTSGRYLVDDVPAEEFDPADWVRRVAYVPQEPRLLHATVADNIRFMRPGISDAQVEAAARLAHIHEDISGWSGGYERMVGQRADAVSGGQRQRLCLARALVTEPEVLILDEPTSALDPRSEALIQRSLSELRSRGVTLIIVAHRPAMLTLTDVVLLLDGGRQVAFGPPREVAAHGVLAGELLAGAPPRAGTS